MNFMTWSLSTFTQATVEKTGSFHFLKLDFGSPYAPFHSQGILFLYSSSSRSFPHHIFSDIFRYIFPFSLVHLSFLTSMITWYISLYEIINSLRRGSLPSPGTHIIIWISNYLVISVCVLISNIVVHLNKDI